MRCLSIDRPVVGPTEHVEGFAALLRRAAGAPRQCLECPLYPAIAAVALEPDDHVAADIEQVRISGQGASRGFSEKFNRELLNTTQKCP